MKTTSLHRTKSSTWIAAPAAFLATLLALPVNAAIDIPDDPLTTAARVAPNILFILDDSGSMASTLMPDGVPNDWRRQTYIHNTLYFDPNGNYQPWVIANGNRRAGGTSYNQVYGSFNLVGGTTIDLGDAGSCRTFNNNSYNTNSGVVSADEGVGTQVCGGVQTYYVPKNTSITDAAHLATQSNYYRYQIQTTAQGGNVVRSELGNVSLSTSSPMLTWNGLQANSDMANINNFNVPAGTSRIIVRSSGGTYGDNSSANNSRGGGADLYVRYNANPTTFTSNCNKTGGNNTHECVIDNPAQGQWRFGLQAASRYRSVTVTVEFQATNSCSGSLSGNNQWINCQDLPTDQRDAIKLKYATWFSYYRTRMKAAKAGGSEAFGELDGKVRVGFRTIWNRNGFDIPVTDGNDGRFVDNAATSGNAATTSRTQWYDRLHGAMSANGTPLRRALDDAGQYFSLNTSDGPYGPLSGVNQYACRQNFSILTTDGYWNGAQASTSEARENVDDTEGPTITRSPNSFTYENKSPYRDGYSNTLADVAMYYWKNDLRDDLDDIVPSSGSNPAFWQHMVTFGISIGLSTQSGYTSVGSVPADMSWPDPQTNITDGNTTVASRIDDLLHAAVNGRGAFVAASNPAQFTAGLKNALNEISNRTSSYSNIASNSVSLETGTRVYSASYTTGSWTGQLTARAVSAAGVGAVQWNSSIPAWDSRKVFTRAVNAEGVAGGVSFPSTSQVGALARTGGEVRYQVSGVQNANYLKGDDSLEERRGNSNGKRLRNRTSILGDIVSSSPAYVVDTNTLYVGANDGMMHAFDASNGQELFAYVPSILNFNHLATLSRGDYAHKFFVDGPITVSSKDLTPDKHVLVGTLGRGGKGLYALDVTDPNASGLNAAAVAKWERSDTQAGNMGLVLGKPILAKAGGSTVAVIGNGVNSTTGRAVLIVLDAETGDVIKEIDTEVGSPTAPNGLSAPTGAYQADGKTLRYVFAGDMQGNVWKFDLTNASTAEWSATRLFTATDGTNAQPITAKVAIATHPLTRERWVFFGTGRYLTATDADATSTGVQGMYGIIDKSEAVERSELTQRTVTVTVDAANSASGMTVRAFEAKSALPVGSKGWYINLPETGERIVQDAQVASGFLVTASMVPTGTACDADGSGYINALSAFTGTSGGNSFFDLNGQNGTSDDKIGENNIPVGSVNTGAGMPTLPNILRGLTIVGGTSVIGSTGGVGIGGGQPSWERVSWIEARRD